MVVPLLDPTIASTLPLLPVAVLLSPPTRLLLDKSTQFVAAIQDRTTSMITLYLAAGLSLHPLVDPAPLLINARSPTPMSPPQSAGIGPLATLTMASWEPLQANTDVNVALTPPKGETLKDDLAMAPNLVWGVTLCTMQMSALTFLF